MKAHEDINGTEVSDAIYRSDFSTYQNGLIHQWLRTVSALVFGLVPLFFLLDIVMLPSELIPQFAIYRGISTVLAFSQFLLVSRTPPSRWSYIHGYFTSTQVGAVIVLMTVDLGGFNSGYYAGLILVMIGVSLVLPWRGHHTAVNSLVIIAMYVSFNLYWHQPFDTELLINNLFFLFSAGIIAVAITELRYQLIANEFSLLVKLKHARDSLWSEMELAKEIQMSLLPKKKTIYGYDVSAYMQPAKEVGGDYYEVLETNAGTRYIAIGDVAGHGVSAGLIMMMAQTSLITVLKNDPNCSPEHALQCINSALRENIGRLGSDHFMTMSVLKLGSDSIEFAGRHQDIIIYRAATQSVEIQPTTGTWLGISDFTQGFFKTTHMQMHEGDTLLLFTDGLTEAENTQKQMFGQERLISTFIECAAKPPSDIIQAIVARVESYQDSQSDDMTLVVVKKTTQLEEPTTQSVIAGSSARSAS